MLESHILSRFRIPDTAARPWSIIILVALVAYVTEGSKPGMFREGRRSGAGRLRGVNGEEAT